MQLVEVEVMRLGLDRSTNSYVVILQEKGGARLLPIWIGQPEAESIVIEMNKLKVCSHGFGDAGSPSAVVSAVR
ncbi:MAG: bifunctional nuclease domain-containing protein [Gemmatimonadaceae bacterium]